MTARTADDEFTNPEIRPRFAELTYTSFDDGRSAGGWQVKQERGELDDAERTFLISKIGTRLEPGRELPPYPSPEQLAQLPRRLVYAPTARWGWAWWHTSAAGQDGSGRPGNVFAQILLDRRPEIGGPRPIDLWGSAAWLTPFGPSDVSTARLTDQIPAIGTASTRAVVKFLHDPAVFRIGVLVALLDGCAAALTGGPRVVLLTDGNAASWIAALSHAMPSSFARRLAFSTYETAETLMTALELGVHIACLPRSAAGDLTQVPRIVVVDEFEPPSIGVLSATPHRTAAGVDIAVTEWSVLTEVALLDEVTASAILDELDPVVTSVGSSGSEPGWAMAVVASHRTDDFADALGEAANVLIRSSPDELRWSSNELATAAGLIEQFSGISPRDAWNKLAANIHPDRPLTVAGEVLLRLYVRRVLADPVWLLHESEAPYPSPRLIEKVDVVEDELCLEAIRRVDGNEWGLGEDDLCVILVRLTNFLARLNELTSEIEDAVQTAMERWLIHRLIDVSSIDLVGRLDQLTASAQSRTVRPLVELALRLHPRPVGEQLSTAVLRWMFPDGLEAEPHDGTRLHAELVNERWRTTGRLALDERGCLATAMLSDRARSLAEHDLGPLFDGAAWDPLEAYNLVRRWPATARGLAWLPTLKSAPATQALRDLAGEVEAQTASTSLWDINQLARLRGRGTMAANPEQMHFQAMRTLSAAAEAERRSDLPFAPDLVAAIQVASLLTFVENTGMEHLNGVVAALRQHREMSQESFQAAEHWVRMSAAQLVDVAVRTVLVAPDLPAPLESHAAAPVVALTVGGSDTAVIALLRLGVRRLGDAAPGQIAVKSAIVHRVAELAPASDRLSDRMRYVDDWLKRWYPPSESLLSRIRKRESR